MKSNLNGLLILTIVSLISGCNGTKSSGNNSFLEKYQGKPYADSTGAEIVQTIPGKLQCEFYDLGGPSVAYQDSDVVNNGSGSLNKGAGYLNNFRIGEGPDISYTKFHDSIDNSPYDLVQPEIDQFYLGWTKPGEWTRYTMNVNSPGMYKIGAMYTSNRGGAIRFIIDDSDSTELLNIKSTFSEIEPLAWRQWHHWNFNDSLTSHHFDEGKHILTLRIEKEGNFNFDYFLFTRE